MAIRDKYIELNRRMGDNYLPDTNLRYSGGNNPNRESPFVSGYWYLGLIPPEEMLPSAGAYVRLFNSTAESFTPPARTIVKEEVIATSNIKKMLITNQELGNTFSLSFRETHNMHVSNVISEWTSSAINPYTGHINKNYKGHCVVIVAKPAFGNAARDIGGRITYDMMQNVYFFHGVFPETDSLDKIQSDIKTNDSSIIDISFNFDGAVMDKAFDAIAFINDFNLNLGDFTPYSPYTTSPMIGPYRHRYR